VTHYELKSLLYDYLAILRAPGGGEKIGFAIESHIKHLDLMEAYGGARGEVSIRDLPRYQETSERFLAVKDAMEEEALPPYARVESFPKCQSSI